MTAVWLSCLNAFLIDIDKNKAGTDFYRVGCLCAVLLSVCYGVVLNEGHTYGCINTDF